MTHKGFLLALMLVTAGCASIPESAFDQQGKIFVRVISPSYFRIGGKQYPSEAAQYWLNRLRKEHRVKSLEFLVDSVQLQQKIKRGDWLYGVFKGCSEAEVAAFMLAHDTYFGNPEAIFEFDPITGNIGEPTPCSAHSFTMEM